MCNQNRLQEAPDFSELPVSKTENLRENMRENCDITHSIFDASTRKIDVFLYETNFHDKTAAASYKYLLLKVETRINRATFPPLLHLVCDL